MTARVAESCGTLATVTDALTREELARTALACPPFTLAIRLAEWVGDSRELTSTSVLRPAVAVQACQALGIALPVGKLRSAKDVFELARAWDAAVAADLVLVTANRASAAPDVADFARAAGGTVALGPELTERAAIAWLRDRALEWGEQRFADRLGEELVARLIALGRRGEALSEVEACWRRGGQYAPADYRDRDVLEGVARELSRDAARERLRAERGRRHGGA